MNHFGRNFFLLTVFSIMASAVAFGDDNTNIEQAIIGKWKLTDYFCGERPRKPDNRTFEFHPDGKVDIKLFRALIAATGGIYNINYHAEGTYSFDNNGHLIITMTKVTIHKTESGMPPSVQQEEIAENPAIDKFMNLRVDGNKLSGTYLSGASSRAIAKVCSEGSLHFVYLRM